MTLWFIGAAALAGNRVVVWGENFAGQDLVPTDLTNATMVAAGAFHCVALRSDSTVVAWGHNQYGECNVPPGLSNVIAVSAGWWHSLALKADGTVVAWGAGMTNANTNPDYGQSIVPANLSNVVAIVGGYRNSLALKLNGTAVEWGYNLYGQDNVPGSLTTASAVAGANDFSLALKKSGTVVKWGASYSGLGSVPTGLNNVAAIAAGRFRSFAIQTNGSAVAWGVNYFGEGAVPAGLHQISSISCGDNFTMARKTDGTLVAWGDNSYGETNIPPNTANVLSFSCGIDWGIALAHDLAPVILQSPSDQISTAGGTAVFNASVSGESPLFFQWQKNGMNISDNDSVTGSASSQLVLRYLQTGDAGMYSLVVSNSYGIAIVSNANLTVLAGPTNCGATAPSGMVAWWRGENNTLDSAGTNTAALAFSMGYGTGEAGTGFQTTAGSLNVPASPSLNVGSGPGMTLEMWLNPGSGNSMPLFEWNDGQGNIGANLYLNSYPISGILQADFVDTNGGSHQIASTAGAITSGVWQHVAATYDQSSGNAALFINGSQVVQANLGTFTPQTQPNLYLGYRASGTDAGLSFVGSMDEMAIYNRSLTMCEVQSIYVAGSAGKCPPVPPTQQVPNTVFYVDASNTCPSSPFAHWGNAANSIQDALDVAPPGSVIWVNDGVYQTGARSMDGTTTNRIVATNGVTIESVHGPAATIIDGGGAARCAYLANGAVLSGFTLTNGYTAGDGGGVWCATTQGVITNCALINNRASGSGGGAAYGTLLNCRVLNNTLGSFFSSGGGLVACQASNCVIGGNSANYAGGGAMSCVLTGCLLTNNLASQGYGGGADLCTLNACVLTGNNGGSEGGGALFSTLNNCLLAGNNSEFGGGANGCTLNNCTLTGNSAYFDGGGANGCTLNNCIVWFNACLWGGAVDYTASSALNFCCAPPPATNGVGNITFAPMFLNQGGGDFHLQASSPCINSGSNAYVNATSDLDGNPRIFQGTVDMGAYEIQTPEPALAIALLDYTNTLPGLALNFSGGIFRGSYDFSYWDFGDGTLATNQFVLSHAWTTAGNYPVTLRAMAATGMVASATLQVHVAAIQVQPPAQTATIGNVANFTISSENCTPLAWQWIFNASPLPGATNATLNLVNVQTSQGGSYSALVTLALPAGYPPGQFTVTASNALLMVNPPVCVTPPASLIGWWRGESNALDEVSGNDGVLMNGTGFAPGRVGTAFSFDGVSNYVQIAATPSLAVHGEFTVEAWIRLNAPVGTNGATILMRTPDDGSPVDWALTIGPSQKLRAQIQITGDWQPQNTFAFEGNTTLQPGLWYHITLVRYEIYMDYIGPVDFLAAFVNGNFDGQVYSVDLDPAHAESKAAHPLKIGGSPSDGSFFPGLIDDVSIYSRALNYSDGGELASLYNAGGAGKCEMPVGPSIVVNLEDTSVLPGTNTAFTIIVGGSRPLSYQWLVNGLPIVGETNATLTLTNIQYSQSGNIYSYVATNAVGSVTSSNATLTVINTPPQIFGLMDQVMSYSMPAVTLPFGLSDAESPAGSLQVTGNSSNTNLLPNTQIVLAGMDTNRTVTLSPSPNQFGVSTVTLTVTDPGNLSNQMSFRLSVTNFPPQISPMADQVISYNTVSAPLAFTISDFETPADALVLSANSSNTNLLPVSQISFAGSGTNRVVILTPNPNQLGIATVTLSVADELGAISQRVFNLAVTNFPPQISTILGQHSPLNAQIGPLYFNVTDDNTPYDHMVVTASSSNPSILSTNQIVVATLSPQIATSNANHTITIFPGTNAPGLAVVTLMATDSLGASSTMSFSVTWDQFTSAATLPALTYGAVAFGDYDGDGRQDLLVSGTTNGTASGAVTRIYHNTSNNPAAGMFSGFISLTNVWKSAVAWCDFDRDGWLDAIVSGLNAANQPVTMLYRNNGDGTFTATNTGFAGAYSGTLAWGDFDNDGAPDLFLSGLSMVGTNNGAAVITNMAKLYRNNGSGSFTDMNLNLLTSDNRTAGPSLGTAAWGDFDNDGKPDLLLVGATSPGTGMANIYRNLGNGNFTNIFNSTIVSYSGGTGAWGDYNGDGWLDVVISGANSSTLLYRNNGNGTFTQTASFSGNSTPSVAWGDFNNDGWSDLLIAGNGLATLYRNNGGSSFTSTGISLPQVLNGTVAWADANGDGNLDILFANSASAQIYQNNNFVTNTPPIAPLNALATTTASNSVIFTWSKAFDAQTVTNGLTYNLRVGTTTGASDVVTPLADPVTGLRRVTAPGNAGPTNRALLFNLPQSTYYWSVQAMDAAFAGSTFAAERTFTITNARPTISAMADLFITAGTNAPGPVMAFTIGDLETGASNLVLSARSSNTNVVAPANIVFGGSGSNRTVRIAARTNGVSLITVTVTDAQGAFANAYFNVHAEPFTLVASNFVQVQRSLVAWGDYNNDGRLDVLIAGNTNGSLELPPVTQLYRNDGNGIFTPVASGLPNVSQGSATWGDFNNDGNPDLVLTGTTNDLASGAIARIYRNNGDGTFTDIGAGLPGVYYSAVAWGDFDNDGRLDLLLTGSSNGLASGALTSLYHNNGDGTFRRTGSLTNLYQGAVACADLDGDGRLDIVIAGMNSSGAAVAQVYRNQGDGTFALMPTAITGVYNCALAVGDYNNDGLPDILLAGYNGSYLTRAYPNKGNFSFTDIVRGLPGARYASLSWGDLDNDGRLDFLISGTSNGLPSGAFARIYRNTGSSNLSQSFTNYPASFPTNFLGAVACADFNNDGKLDILLTGTDGVTVSGYARSQTMLFRNNANVANTPPTAPTALAATHSNNLMALTWAKSTDAQTTNANGIKYQIRVGAAPGGTEIESPGADLATGFRRSVQTGDASTNVWRLVNLPPGNYFWSVQAIDTAFAGSPFSQESMFTVLPPPTAMPDAFATAMNTPVTFTVAKLALNDLDPNGYPLTVTGVSSNGTLGGNVWLTNGQLTYTPPANFSGNDVFTYTISDGQSAAAVGTATVTIGSGGTISLNIVSGPAEDAGNFVVRFAGIPGFNYTIEASSALIGPWTKVANLTAPVADQGFGIGVFEFQEPVGTNSTRFYRTIYPAY